jgi:hypothetical protein
MIVVSNSTVLVYPNNYQRILNLWRANLQGKQT